jgi:hypothetical protein
LLVNSECAFFGQKGKIVATMPRFAKAAQQASLENENMFRQTIPEL